MSGLTMARLADNIRRAIKASGLTQAEVADRAEMDPSALSKILSGKRKVSSLDLALICTATGSDVLALLEAEPIHGPSFRQGIEFASAHPDGWSDGRRRDRRSPACGYDGDGRRAIIGATTQTCLVTEVEPQHWTVNVSGEWGNMLDVAEAILAADRELRSSLCRHCGAPPETDGDHSCACPLSDEDCTQHPSR